MLHELMNYWTATWTSCHSSAYVLSIFFLEYLSAVGQYGIHRKCPDSQLQLQVSFISRQNFIVSRYCNCFCQKSKLLSERFSPAMDVYAGLKVVEYNNHHGVVFDYCGFVGPLAIIKLTLLPRCMDFPGRVLNSCHLGWTRVQDTTWTWKNVIWKFLSILISYYYACSEYLSV